MTGTSVPRSVMAAAWRQARTTVVRKYTSASGIGSVALIAALLVALWFLRDVDFGDGAVAAGSYVLTGFLAFGVVAAAVMGVAGELQAEREDGTLLRAKAVPHGMTGHLIAKLIVAPVDALVPVVPAAVGATVLLPGTMPDELGRWALLAVVFLLAVAAMLPWGAILGSVFRSMLGLAWAMMGMYAVAALSGLFYPVTALPAVLQWLAHATPLYWIGHAVRAVLLPPEAAAVEFGGEWRIGLTVVVLVAWAVVGLLVAPVVLRRMARRQSGRTVAAARERVLSRGY
ncbi:ABC transporter permease [Intrasporangium sp.]|uniref:ABC transporter permease n=1 Tax=Intrasporangium sp. TaxID=1925024 RepID=UPI00293A04B9|nr:ABC transporter permease [Intrasporangium sp.]MDV3222418.1 ABC transporter permease [Intrasporangium sp.]